jgi:aspartate racemase
MRYQTTLRYYKAINRAVNKRLGGLNSADITIRSLNFADIFSMMQENEWERIASELKYEAFQLWHEDICDHIVIASSTMHKVADEIDRIWTESDSIDPETYKHSRLVHIGDCIAEKCHNMGVERVVLLGTKQVMMEDYLRDRISAGGIEVPTDISEFKIDLIDSIIVGELYRDINDMMTRDVLRDITREIVESNDADAVVVCCDELFSALSPEEFKVFPLIDATEAHIDKLIKLSLHN